MQEGLGNQRGCTRMWTQKERIYLFQEKMGERRAGRQQAKEGVVLFSKQREALSGQTLAQKRRAHSPPSTCVKQLKGSGW